MVYEGILSSTVSCQHICDKTVGHLVFRVKHANHLVFLNDEYSGRHNRSCSRRVYRLAPPKFRTPKKSPGPRISTTASLPVLLTTVSFTPPS
jgi:hypothetical protein